jgi:PIN domain nuclease of toxin-antitoxin system
MQDGRMDKFSATGKSAIEKATRDKNLFVSVISVWEVGLLDSKGRISLSMDCERWIKAALATPGLELAPLTPSIAILSTRLPGEFHGDPADRILVATARMEGAHLLTKDQKILDYARMKYVSVMSA